MLRFDWYAATVAAEPGPFVDQLNGLLGGGEIVRTRGLHGYTNGFEINTGAGVVARVLAGGVNGHPHAWASGSDTDRFVEVLRATWPNDHHVTRLDTCEDFDEVGAWERLSSECLKIADEYGLKVNQAGDFHRGIDGRTIYIGSRKSPCFVRLYEKGKQMRLLHPQRADEFSQNWVRIEALVRPQDEARKYAATVTPAQAWGFSQTTRRISERCLGLAASRISTGAHHSTDDDRALDAMCEQYGNILTRLRLRVGSGPAAWADLAARMERIERVRRARNLFRGRES